MICVLAVFPAFSYFAIVEDAGKGCRYFIAILWFLLTVVVVQTGMAIRTLNTCYYDGRPYGSAPMICHTLWHISLVSVFSWNCLHRPNQLKDKDSCDKIGNHFGLDNSLTRSKKQQDE